MQKFIKQMCAIVLGAVLTLVAPLVLTAQSGGDVPARDFFERMGARVDWYGPAGRVTVSLEGNQARFYTGEGALYINDLPAAPLAVPVALVYDTTYIHAADAQAIVAYLTGRPNFGPHGAIAFRHLEFINENLPYRFAHTVRERETAEWIAQELVDMGHSPGNIYLQEFSIDHSPTLKRLLDELNVLEGERPEYIPPDFWVELGALNIHCMSDFDNFEFIETSQNVILTVPGQSERRIIVGAHYDGVNNVGISDNASGVAVLLESAQRILHLEHYYTITYIFFGAEEFGFYGAYYYFNALEETDDIVLMINVDVLFDDLVLTYGVGYHDFEANVEGSNELSRRIEAIGDALNAELGFELVRQPNGIFVSTDQLVFVEAGQTVLVLYAVEGFALRVPELPGGPQEDILESESIQPEEDDTPIITERFVMPIGLVLHTDDDHLAFIAETWPGLIERALLQYGVFLERVLTMPASRDAFSERAFEHFLSLLEIPRGSGYERQVSDFLVAFAHENGLEVMQDEALNVLIRKPGSAGRENEQPVIFQAHMDIVWDKNEGVVHDFHNDPIIPIIDGDWVTADGTTLGADNGAGIAIIMAVLEATDISHPPIEAIITTEEETTLRGALTFDVSLLEGRRFINIDGYREADFLVSCASAVIAIVTVPLTYEAVPADFAAYRLMVSGLIGGHSGVDIHRGRANANALLGELLQTLTEDFDVRIADIAGGIADNAIPREGVAVVMFDAELIGAVRQTVDDVKNSFRERYPAEVNLLITIEQTEIPMQVMDAASSGTVIQTILATPTGVQVMSPYVEDFVQTSSNLGIISTENGIVVMVNLLRSSDLDDEAALIDRFERMGHEFDVLVDITIQMGPWVYREDSPLRDLMAEVYLDFFGRPPNIIAIHAGLETAIFAAQMPDADFISIGVEIWDLHIPDERMYIPSFNRMAGFVVRVLEELTD